MDKKYNNNNTLYWPREHRKGEYTKEDEIEVTKEEDKK
jgi:hypothetical protein